MPSAVMIAMGLGWGVPGAETIDGDRAIDPVETRAAYWVFLRERSTDRRGEAEIGERARARRARHGRSVGETDRWPDAVAVARVLAHGDTTLRSRSRWLNAISVETDPVTIAEIEAMDEVERTRAVGRRAAPVAVVAPVRPETLARSVQTGPQMDLMGSSYLRDCGFDGTGVVIAVQDTGFDLSHESLRGVDVIGTRDFLNDDADVGPEDGDPEGQEAHGTMVLSLIAGDAIGSYESPAPRAQYLLSKTEDVSVEMPFEEDRFVEGLEWAEAVGADIFTASLGYIDWYDYADLDGETAVTTVAVNQAVANGLLVFNANGNGGPASGSLIAPADAPGVVAVGAVDVLGGLAEFSSRGPSADGRIKPDLVAPGSDVTVADWTDPTHYLVGGGTSFATPLLAGLGAQLVQAYPTRSADEIRSLLKATASDTDSPNNDWGWGLVSGLGAGMEACTCRDVDADGELDPLCGGNDCNDGDASVRPNATEICDGVDTNCDGVLGEGEDDVDRDGVPVCAGDCADDDPAVHPAKPEDCENGVDDDCDGLVDLADVSECAPEDEGGTEGGAADTGGGGCSCTLEDSSAPRGSLLAFLLVSGSLRRRARRYSAASPAT